MKRTPILILAGDAGWLPLFDVASEHEGDTSPALCQEDFLLNADAVLEALNSHDKPLGTLRSAPGAGAGVVIGVASHRCYTAKINAAGLPARQLRQALPYRFETSVPFAAEDLVLDAHGHGEDPVVVATHYEWLHTFVHALEDAGVQVCGIAPLAMLAAQSMVTNIEDVRNASGKIVLRIAELPALCTKQTPSLSVVDVVAGQSGSGGAETRINRWRWLPGTTIQDAEPKGAQSSVVETLRHAHAAVQRVVPEEEALWINLQRGPLASRHQFERVRRPLTACFAAAAIFLIALIGAMQFRAWQYHASAAQHDEKARSLYADAFPGEAVPASMDRRLKTKLRELRGRQGLATPDTRLYDDESTLVIVHDLLERLPDDTRLVITDLRLSGDRIDIVGHARSHSDADRIAASLRGDGRFEVTPPSTEALPSQGVQFSLNVTPVADASRNTGGTSGSLAAEQTGSTSPSPGRAQGGTP